MYKIASENAQRAVSRIDMADMMQERDQWSARDRYDALVRALKNTEERLLRLPKGDERAALGRRKQDMQAQLNSLRPIAHLEHQQREGIAQTFFSVAREILSRAQFKTIFAAAQIQFDKDAAALAKAKAELEAMPVIAEAAE